jgi:hypothetical protein
MKKVVDEWEALPHFEQHVRCLPVVETVLPPCRWKCCCVLFLLIRFMLVMVDRFVASGPFCFLFSILPWKLQVGLLCFFFSFFQLHHSTLFYFYWEFCSVVFLGLPFMRQSIPTSWTQSRVLKVHTSLLWSF